LSGPASDIDYRTNPRALKWWRLKNHYSQRDVGTLEKLAQIYGCTIEDLIVISSQLLA
jgi:hypothetical protein